MGQHQTRRRERTEEGEKRKEGQMKGAAAPKGVCQEGFNKLVFVTSSTH